MRVVVICSIFLLFTGLAGAQLLRSLFCGAGKQFRLGDPLYSPWYGQIDLRPTVN